MEQCNKSNILSKYQKLVEHKTQDVRKYCSAKYYQALSFLNSAKLAKVVSVKYSTFPIHPSIYER